MERNKKYSFPAFCLGIAALLLFIQAGGSFHGNKIVFPDVREIGEAFIRLLSQKETYEQILTTLLHLVYALALSMAAGVLTGAAEGLSAWIYSGFKPFMIFVRSLPMIILVILIMTVLPYEYVPVAAGAVVLLPLISEAVCEGIRSIEPELTDVYRLNSGFNANVFCHVHLPLISGYLKQAFFNAAGTGLKVVVSAEYLVQAKKSLGKAVYSSSYFLEYAEIYAYALIMVLLVLLVTELPFLFLRLRDKKNTFQQEPRG